jgi:DNA-binding transcriptional MerR regulator/methylmalonyl-CoA mutase cobalamin-binding subunit
MPRPSGDPLPMRTLASLTGVNPITLRAWERRYGLLHPKRTPKGHRVYTHEDVELIRRVLALTERGVPIGQVRQALETPVAARAGHASGAWADTLERMAAAIARFDGSELDHIYDEVLAVYPVEHMTNRLLLPLLARLGQRWEGLPGAIAEEHFFAMYMRSKLGARLLHRARYAEGPRLLAACGPGEHHEVGLMLFAIEAHQAGMRPVLLGANTPLAEIGIAQHRSGCDAVVISSSVDPPARLLGRELPELVRAAGVPVFVGGASALRNRAAFAAAGAIPLGREIEDGVRLIMNRLRAKGRA